MLEVLQEFEQTASGLRPVVLIVPGLIGVLLGLFVWLGGLGLRRLVMTLVGVIIGVILGYFVIGRNIGAAVILGLILGLVAVVLEKIFVMVTLAGMVLLVGLFIFASVYGEVPEDGLSLPGAVAERIPTENIRESLEKVKEFAGDVLGAAWDGTSGLPAYWWLVLVGAVGGMVAIGFLLKRVASALCCSMLGAMMMFSGMGMLLLYKGSAPLSRMVGQGKLYGAVFGGMTVFGTVMQLVLCQRKEAAKKKAKKDAADGA